METSQQSMFKRYPTSTYSLEDFRAKVSALLEKDKDLKTHEAHSFLMSHGFSRLKNQTGYYSKTLKVYLTTTPEKLLQQSTEFLLSSGIPLAGKWLIVATSESHKTESESLLSDILEKPEDVPEKYFLSKKSDKRAIQDGTTEEGQEITWALRGRDYKDGSNFVAVKSGTWRTHKDGNGFREVESGLAPTIPARAREDGSGQPVINNGVNIRRLTPKECERLQGFPDNWTKKRMKGDTITETSDTQRYKTLGNAVTTNVITAIMRRIYEVSI